MKLFGMKVLFVYFSKFLAAAGDNWSIKNYTLLVIGASECSSLNYSKYTRRSLLLPRMIQVSASIEFLRKCLVLVSTKFFQVSVSILTTDTQVKTPVEPS